MFDFSEVDDFRVKGRCTHTLGDILGLVLIGIIADCDDFSEIADYGRDNIGFLRAEVGLPLLGGIPSEDTLERVLKYLNTKQLQDCYLANLGEVSLLGKHLCIDGKELRSTIPSGKKHALVQMVNVWVQESGLSFGQYRVAKKSNEITAIPALLQSLDCEGATITIDAIGCQKEVVKTIIGQKAHYFIAVKDNQRGLVDEVVAAIGRCGPAPKAETIEKGHGRIETRRAWVCTDLRWMDDRADWAGLCSVAMVERTRLHQGKETVAKQLYISSIETLSATQALRLARDHWGIENGLHWQLDITFGEDDAKVRHENAIINLHQIRKWALVILKKLPTKVSIKRKRKMIARDKDLLLSLLAT